MMLAGLPVAAEAVEELAALVRLTGATELANRVEQALDDKVKLLALSLDERALMLSALEDPPQGLADLRAVLLADHQWRRREGLGYRDAKRRVRHHFPDDPPKADMARPSD